MPRPFIPDRIVALRIVAALAPVAVVALVWLASRSSDLPHGRIVQITHSRNFEGQPSLSPDGSLIAFRCDYDGNSDICVIDADGANLRNLTANSREDESEPAFAPDGRTIAFRAGSRGIATITIDGGSPVAITSAGRSPAWTPDGGSIVYSVDTVPGGVFRPGFTEGQIVDIETRTTRRLGTTDFRDPAVSPHAKRIAYVGRPFAGAMRRGAGMMRTDVWTIPIDGGAAVRVTNDAATEASPLWSVNGKYLYYVSDRNGSSAIWCIGIDEETGRPARRGRVVPTPYTQPNRITRSADGTRIAWADAQSIERLMRVAFDEDARSTRGAPVEIAANRPEWDDSDPPGELPAPEAPAAANALLTANSFPGHWSPQRTLYAGTANGAIWIYSPVTRQHYQLRPGRSPVWLNDGRRLIYSSEGRLFIAEAVLKISRELLALSDQILASPRLSPDNRRLYFTAEGSDANLWVLTVDDR